MGQGESIRAARGRLRMTQAALAAAAGVGVNTVKRAEGGLAVQDETIRSLCAVLGLDAASYPRRLVADEPAPAAAGAVAVPSEPYPAPWESWKEWDPSPELRALLALGIIGLVAAPFVLVHLAWSQRGGFPRFASPPAPFDGLDLGLLNATFSGAMLFVLMACIGTSLATVVLREFVSGSREDDWPSADAVAEPMACMACFLVLVPFAGGWGILQQAAMLVTTAQDFSWMSGLALVGGQALAVVRLARACGPLVQVPPLLPFALAVGFLMLAPATGPADANAVAMALVLACAAALRRSRRPAGMAGPKA